MGLNIKTGPTNAPLRIILQGQEGVGKTTWAARCPKALFLTCEDGGGDLDYARVVVPSWAALEDAIDTLITEGPEGFRTIVIDTIDSFERLLHKFLCEDAEVKTIEEVGGGYGKGYTRAAEAMHRLASLLDMLRNRHNVNIILLAHVHVRPFNDPTGSTFDRYEMRMHKGAAGMWFSWADAVLFACFDITVQKTGKKGRVVEAGAMDKGKATDVKRVVYTSKDAAYDAKNRHNLPDELPLDWSAFSRAIRWDERGAPPAPRHDPSWDADRSRFCAALGEIGVKYENAADYCAAKGWPRPSAMSQKNRDAFLASMKDEAKRAAFDSWLESKQFETAAPAK